MTTDEINKKLDELIKKNADVFSDFVTAVSNADLGIYHKTFQEKDDFEKENQFRYLGNDFLKSPALGLKAFFTYGEIVMNCINKMAINDHKKEFAFKENEVLNHEAWQNRVRRVTGGEVWLDLYKSLFECIVVTHDARVNAMRNKEVA